VTETLGHDLLEPRASALIGATFVASGPFWPSRSSNSTRAPSVRLLKPSPAMLL
jgi:hypothetical protein